MASHRECRIQSILLPKEKFDRKQAVAWLKENDFEHGKIDEAEHFWRARQHNPAQGAEFFTISLGDHAMGILECVKEQNHD